MRVKQKMWGAIDGMSKEIQELIQRDAGTDGEDDTKQLLASVNPAKNRPVPAEASTIAQTNLVKMGPTWSFFSIFEEDVANLNNSFTSGLLSQGLIEGMGASGSGGLPVMAKF